MSQVAIIIPTYNQSQALTTTLMSVCRWTRSQYRIYVVDNSKEKYAKKICETIDPYITVLEPEGNLGWMGGINYGIDHSDEPYILMLNDDIRILDYDYQWLQRLLNAFKLPKMGVTVPSSNAVMGFQNMENAAQAVVNYVPCVSGLCLLTKRSIVQEVGNLDESLPGGDDIDFSIRVRKGGYLLGVCKNVFVYHYGSLTGRSVYGGHWNSPDYAEAADKALIQKHGLRALLVAKSFTVPEDEIDDAVLSNMDDERWEHDTMVPYCEGDGADIGCGAYKIVENAIGIDITPKGEMGTAGSQMGIKSVADITVEDIQLPFDDNSLDYIVAKHVFEHITDSVAALTEWVRVLKPQGKLIVAVPDEDVCDGLPLDPTHKHAFSLSSYKRLLGAVTQYKTLKEKTKVISFVHVAEIA